MELCGLSFRNEGAAGSCSQICYTVIVEPSGKICTACEQEKPREEFYRCTSTDDGLQYRCKPCDKKRNKGRHRSTPAASRAWRQANPDHERVRAIRDPGRHKRQYWKDPEKKRAITRRWSKQYPHKAAANAAKRRAVKLRATPPWLTVADHAEMAGQHHFAAIMTQITGWPHEVDHGIPLQGRGVRGLHVPWNLRAITEGENRRKHNKIEAVEFGATPRSLQELIEEAERLAG